MDYKIAPQVYLYCIILSPQFGQYLRIWWDSYSHDFFTLYKTLSYQTGVRDSPAALEEVNYRVSPGPFREPRGKESLVAS